MKNNLLKRQRLSLEEDRVSKRPRKSSRAKAVSTEGNKTEFDADYWDPESVSLQIPKRPGTEKGTAAYPVTPKNHYYKEHSISSSRRQSGRHRDSQTKSHISTEKQLPNQECSVLRETTPGVDKTATTPGSSRSLRSQGPPSEVKLKKNLTVKPRGKTGRNHTDFEKRLTPTHSSEGGKTVAPGKSLSTISSPDKDIVQCEIPIVSTGRESSKVRPGRKSLVSSRAKSRAKTRGRPVKEDDQSSGEEPWNVHNSENEMIASSPLLSRTNRLDHLDNFEADEHDSWGRKSHSVCKKKESIVTYSPVKKNRSSPKDEIRGLSGSDQSIHCLNEEKSSDPFINTDPSVTPFHETNGDEEELEPFDEQENQVPEISKISLTDGDTLPEEFFTKLQNHVLGKLMGRIPITLVGQESNYKKIHDLLQQTVVSGESNSCIIHGPRSAGKTSIVNAAIRALKGLYQDSFMVVRLSGYAQTDDRLALKEIARQLANEMDIEPQNRELKSYSDMLTALLGTLSHPEELGITRDDEENSGQSSMSSSVIFVLDEFDQFVHHPRQTLLYNLFDIAQNKKAPIAVLGLTCRFDIADSLEKRVKSRFSHRSYQICLPQSLEVFEEMCKASLFINLSEWGDFEKGKLTSQEVSIIQEWNRHVDVFSCRPCILICLTLLELALLISAAHIDARDSETVNFNMAYEEYRVILKKAEVSAASAGSTASSGAIRVTNRVAALNSWDILGRKGLMVAASGGSCAGGLARECRMWSLEVGLGELQSFVDESSSKLPSIVRRWVKV